MRRAAIGAGQSILYAPRAMRPLLTAIFFAAVVLAGCAPKIGDSCSSSLNCSVNGDRVCDQAQPGGYCSIQSCEADTCPEDAVCVRFRPTPSRFAQSWCMRKCSSTNDCRDEYGCYAEEELNACVMFEPDPTMTLPILEVLDQNRPEDVVRFCAVMPTDCPPGS